jgi:hypothetical protein
MTERGQVNFPSGSGRSPLPFNILGTPVMGISLWGLSPLFEMRNFSAVSIPNHSFKETSTWWCSKGAGRRAGLPDFRRLLVLSAYACQSSSYSFFQIIRDVWLMRKSL